MEVKPEGDIHLVTPLGAQAEGPDRPLTLVFGRVESAGPLGRFPAGTEIVFRPQMGLVTPITMKGVVMHLVANPAVLATVTDFVDEDETTDKGIIIPSPNDVSKITALRRN